MFIKGNDGNMTEEQEDLIERILDSKVLYDLVEDFGIHHLGDESIDIIADGPIAAWHALWDETDNLGKAPHGNLNITKRIKV